MPTVYFRTAQTIKLLRKVNIPITTTPLIWANSTTSGLKIPTAQVLGTLPRLSRRSLLVIFILSNQAMPGFTPEAPYRET